MKLRKQTEGLISYQIKNENELETIAREYGFTEQQIRTMKKLFNGVYNNSFSVQTMSRNGHIFVIKNGLTADFTDDKDSGEIIEIWHIPGGEPYNIPGGYPHIQIQFIRSINDNTIVKITTRRDGTQQQWYQKLLAISNRPESTLADQYTIVFNLTPRLDIEELAKKCNEVIRQAFAASDVLTAYSIVTKFLDELDITAIGDIKTPQTLGSTQKTLTRTQQPE